MHIELVFNELSANEIQSYNDLNSFYNQISDLVSLINLPKLPTITFNDDFANNTYNGLKIYEHLNSTNLSYDIRIFLLSMIQNAPFSQVDVHDGSLQVTFGDKATQGFQYAFVNNVASISVTPEVWNCYQYDVNKHELTTAGQLVSTVESVNHLGPISEHTGTWLDTLLPATDFSNWAEFSTRVPSLYSQVEISQEALNSIKGFPIAQLRKLKEIMDVFEYFCLEKWNDPASFQFRKLKQLNVNVRPESVATMTKYGRQRNFVNEIGEREQYTLHFDIWDDWRGYIKQIPEKKIFIGNIVTHLSTSTES